MEKRQIINGRFKGISYIRAPERFSRSDMLGVTLGKVLLSFNDDTRMLMSSAFSKSAVALLNPEAPLYGSKYLKSIGQANEHYKVKKESDFKLIKIIKREIMENDTRECMIFFNKGRLHVDYSASFEQYAEGTAERKVKNDEKFVSRTVGISPSEEKLNSINALTVYTSAWGLFEDSQMVSESFAKRSSVLVYDIKTPEIRNNMVITSGFPKFKVPLKTKVAFATNSENNYSAILKPKVHYGKDNIYWLDDVGYMLEDLEIYYDAYHLQSDTVLEQKLTNPFLRDLISKDYKFLKEVYDEIQICRLDSMKLGLSTKTFIDDYETRFIKGAKIRDDLSPIDFIKCKMIFTKEVQIVEGGKLSGNFGNKGTVGKVVPDDKFYYTEDGRCIDLLLAQHGVIGRSNPGQLMELTVNFLSWRLLQEVKNKPIEEQIKFILDYVECIDRASYLQYKSKFKNKREAKEIIDLLIEAGGIYFRVEPDSKEFSILNSNKVIDIVISSNPEKFKTINDLPIKIYRNGKYVGRGFVGKIAIMIAKQRAIKKLSLRGRGDVGADGAPKKTDSKSINNNAVKMSEKDYLNMSSGLNSSELRDFEDGDNKTERLQALMESIMLRF